MAAVEKIEESESPMVFSGTATVQRNTKCKNQKVFEPSKEYCSNLKKPVFLQNNRKNVVKCRQKNCEKTDAEPTGSDILIKSNEKGPDISSASKFIIPNLTQKVNPLSKNSKKKFPNHLTKSILRDMMYYVRGSIVWIFS